MFRKILVANRGEIAARIIRACREMGIISVAVYSDVDQNALHVRIADQAVPIGPAPASESYLSIERIIHAAKSVGAQAIHPGYGFLSENGAFAQAVQDAGLIFIGPSPHAIQVMGDKAAAREKMAAAGVPIIPGFEVNEIDLEASLKSNYLEYPLIVKAVAGGGGKGMRIVWEPTNLYEAIESAQHEAERSFGDNRLFIEKYIPNAHHIEIQILADHHGNTLHLFERECSIQRRHQKIIEESPSLLLDSALRKEIGQTAITAAEQVGYHNAGTVEFIFDPVSRSYYFLEMNTRLQVEHPVTEFIIGLDIVHWQIRIAAGERLPYLQEQIIPRGHAIECRLYAEDPANNFLPSTGRLMRFIEPKSPGVRVDSGYNTGDQIQIHYDPLIAKFIVYGENREQAIHKMQSCLRETVILGLTTNWHFLLDILGDHEFISGQAHTTWVEEKYSNWQAPQCEVPAEVLIAAALTQFQSNQSGAYSYSTPDHNSPWRSSSNFRLGEK